MTPQVHEWFFGLITPGQWVFGVIIAMITIFVSMVFWGIKNDVSEVLVNALGAAVALPITALCLMAALTHFASFMIWLLLV